jgi:hypothetical protein
MAGRLQESDLVAASAAVLFRGGKDMRIRTGAFAVFAAAVVSVPLLSATGASAAGAGAVSFTQHFHNEVLFSDPSVNPCTGAPGTVTGTATNGVAHMTTLANGTFWATFTAEGTITFVPDNPADASASGHFAAWDGENGNLRNGTETSTFNAVLSGSDGSRVGVHEVAHMSTSASGGSITFDKPHMTCG